jgi:hypothetical protein
MNRAWRFFRESAAITAAIVYLGLYVALWVPLLFVAAAFWIVGLVWERSAGREIVLTGLELDATEQAFFVTVQNVGERSVKPRVSVIDVTDKSGRKHQNWTRPCAVGWRGNPTHTPVLSLPDAHAEACVLSVGRSVKEKGLLCVQCLVGNQIESVPLTRNDECGSLLITVGADCGGPKRGNSAIKTFEVARNAPGQSWEVIGDWTAR